MTFSVFLGSGIRRLGFLGRDFTLALLSKLRQGCEVHILILVQRRWNAMSNCGIAGKARQRRGARGRARALTPLGRGSVERHPRVSRLRKNADTSRTPTPCPRLDPERSEGLPLLGLTLAATGIGLGEGREFLGDGWAKLPPSPISSTPAPPQSFMVAAAVTGEIGMRRPSRPRRSP